MGTEDEEARTYLDQALYTAGWSYKDASDAIGRSHSYIQQYIKRGKPRWLHQPDREALVRLVPGLDGMRIKPPPKPSKPRVDPKSARRKSQDQPQIDPQRDSQLVYDPGALKLVRAYLKITSISTRETVIALVEKLAGDDDSGSDSIIA